MGKNKPPPITSHQGVDRLDPFSFEASKNRQMYFKSKIEEANYNEILEKLIPTDHIIRYMEVVGSKIKTSLKQLPDRLSARLVHESDEVTIHELIMHEVESVFKQTESMFDSEEMKSSIKDYQSKRKF